MVYMYSSKRSHEPYIYTHIRAYKETHPHLQFHELPATRYAALFGGKNEEGDGQEGALVPVEEIVRGLTAAGLLPPDDGCSTLFVPQVCVCVCVDVCIDVSINASIPFPSLPTYTPLSQTPNTQKPKKGGAFPGAAVGVGALGAEIRSWWEAEKQRRRSRGAGGDGNDDDSSGNVKEQRLAVVLPAGTGTTALGVARALMMATPAATAGEDGGGSDITVYAIPCVGDGGYLRQQMRRLAAGEKGEGPWPVVLEGAAPHVFARPEKGRCACVCGEGFVRACICHR